jgi:hypothetical protein
LIGRNYPNYGEIQNENFIKLLQNFANSQPPSISQNALVLLPGTLWYNTATNVLNVYDGTNFIPTSQRIVANSAPTATSIGDQWYDSTNQQLRSWTGTTWQLVGPAYTASQGKSGAFVETITDTTGNTHTVVSEYIANVPVTVTSIDSVFTVNSAISTSYTNFTTIQPGVNLSTGTTLHGTATNSNTVGGLSSSVFARNDIATSFATDVTVNGNLSFSSANISTANGSFIFQNKNLGGNVEVFINTATYGNVRGMSFSGNTGHAYVHSDPAYPLGIVTKQYADAIQTATNSNLAIAVGLINANVNGVYSNYVANISGVISSTNSNLATVQSSLNSKITATNAAIVTANVGMNAYVNDQISSVNTALASGIASAETMSNLAVASLNTVLTASIGNIQTYINSTINPELTVLAGNITALTAALVPLANIASPTFTGTPTAPTPTTGDNSTQIATTAFIQSAIAAQKFPYTVSPNPPSGGNDGDFWFQIG